MHTAKQSLILLLAILFSMGVVPTNAEPSPLPVTAPQDQNRFVVFEAFMNPA